MRHEKIKTNRQTYSKVDSTEQHTKRTNRPNHKIQLTKQQSN